MAILFKEKKSLGTLYRMAACSQALSFSKQTMFEHPMREHAPEGVSEYSIVALIQAKSQKVL